MLIRPWLVSVTMPLLSAWVFATPVLLAATEIARAEVKIPIIVASEQRRPLNPGPNVSVSESAADRYFRIAYESAVGAVDFDTAMINYRRAREVVTTECEMSYAQAGEQAARETKQAAREGLRYPTQLFWSRLQELTESLSCVYVQ